MNLINYDRYKNWGPRTTIIVVATTAFVTGFTLGLALMAAKHLSRISQWVWILALGFGFAVSTVEAILIALHHCPASPGTPQNKVIPDISQVR